MDDTYKKLQDITKEDKNDVKKKIDFLEIYPIQIMIQSNIPEKQPFTLKSSSFVLEPRPKNAETKGKYEEFPFFTNEFEYPISYLLRMEPYEVMDFFFIRSEFELRLRKYIIKSGITGKTDREENSKTNVMYMLQLLFKTVYPRVNNISNSYREFINTSAPSVNVNMLASFMPTYTYLKESGKTYTVLRTVFLDDIFNNVTYRKLFDSYLEYWVWCKKEKIRIDRESSINEKKINKLIKSYKNYDNDIELIEQRVANIKSNQRGSRGFYEELAKSADLEVLLNMFKNLKLYRDLLSTGKTKDQIKEEMNTNLTKSVSHDPFVTIKTQVELQIFLSKINNGDRFEFKDKEGSWYLGQINNKMQKQNYLAFALLTNTDSNTTISINIFFNENNPIELYTPMKFIDYNLNKIKYNAFIIGDNDKFFHLPNSGSPIKNVNYGTGIESKQNFLLKSDHDLSTQKPKYYVKTDTYIKGNAVIKIKEKNDPQKEDKKQKKEPKDILFDNILDLIQPIFSGAGIRFDRNTTLFINTLVQNYNVGKDSILLSERYLKDTRIDINIPMEKFTGYTTFLNVIKQYLPTQRNTSNSTLQGIIDDYANNQDPPASNQDSQSPEKELKPLFVSLAQKMYECFSPYNPVCDIIKDKRQRENIRPFLETGVSEININTGNHKYEIYIHLDVIEGKLNTENKKQITCTYQDSGLANRLNILTDRKKHGDWLVLPGPFIVLQPENSEDKTKPNEPTQLSKFGDFFKVITSRFTSKSNPETISTKPSMLSKIGNVLNRSTQKQQPKIGGKGTKCRTIKKNQKKHIQRKR